MGAAEINCYHFSWTHQLKVGFQKLNLRQKPGPKGAQERVRGDSGVDSPTASVELNTIVQSIPWQAVTSHQAEENLPA